MTNKGTVFLKYQSKAIIVFALICLSLALYYLITPPIKTLDIALTKDKWFEVNDVNDGGNSQLNYEFTDSSLIFDWNLNKGFSWPYAGVKTLLAKDPLKGISINGYEYIHLKLKLSHDDGLRIILKSPDSERTKLDNPTSYFYHQKEVFPKRFNGELVLKLKDFRIPTWWKEQYNVDLDFDEKALEKLQEIEILNGYSPSLNLKTRVELEELYFSKSDYFLAKIFMLSFLTLIFTGGLKFFSKIKKANQKVKQQALSKLEALRDYKPQEISDTDLKLYEELISYLKLNYSNSELSLQSTSESLKVSPRKISVLLNQKLKLSFKSYLNELRITEAKRLLSETQSNISEISFAVGYNNPSHFNRVFKELVKSSPKDFRKEI